MEKKSPKSKGKTNAARSGTGRKPAPRKDVPAGPGEVCGIGAFAAGIGVSEDFALAVTCAVLTGISGPDSLLKTPWGDSRLPKLDLILSKEDLPACRLLECLSDPVERIDRRLRQNMASSNPEAVGYLSHGDVEIANSKKGRRKLEGTTLRRNLELLQGGLQSDLVLDPLVARMEAVLHPRMLVRKGAGRDLPALVAECHRRCALVVEPGLGLDREGSEPAWVVSALRDLLDGVAVRNQGRSPEQPRIDIDPSRAQVILALGPREREVLAGAGSALLDRLLWLPENQVNPTMPSKPDEGAMFFEIYQTAIDVIIGFRREGHEMMVDFRSPEALLEFHKALRVFETEMTAMNSNPGPSVTGLPQTLFWGMWFLRHSMPEGDGISDEVLIKFVFGCARRLAGIHGAQVQGLRNAGVVSDRLLVAKRVVEKLREQTAPMKFRDLARLFGNQKKERITPVLDALVEARVLLHDDSGGYELGPVELNDVAQSLFKSIDGAGGLEASPDSA